MSDLTASESAFPPTDPKFGLMFIAAEHLIPLFRIGTIDLPMARRMAVSAIEAYQPESRSDYINAARTIAFSITAIALLGRAASDDMTMPEKMRAFGRANTLNRSAVQSERIMIQRRAHQQASPQAEQPVPTPEPPAPNLTLEDTAIDEAELQAAIGSVMKEYMALGLVPPAALITPKAPLQPAALQPTTPQPATTANAHSVSPIQPPVANPVEAIRYNAPASRPQSQPAPHKAELLRTIATQRDAEHSLTRHPR